MRPDIFGNSRLNEIFRSDGCVIVELLDEPDLKALAEAYRHLSHPKRVGFDSTILSHELHYREAVDAAIRARITPHVSSLLNMFRVAFCSFAVKSENCIESAVAMHQDWSFVDEKRFISIGLWCPLIDVDLENGCLQVVRGSHAFPHNPRAAHTPFAYSEIESFLRTRYLEAFPMKAGQAMLFDNRLFHCSPPNRGASERVAAAAVLVPRECKLRYYHAIDPCFPHRMEVFEVEDPFYLTHIAGRRPENATKLGILNLKDEGLDPEGLADESRKET